MRKNLLVLVVLFCCANSAASSQAAPQPASPGTTAATVSLPGANTPKDPAALMKAAEEVNGLDDAKLAPWHLKASYQLYDFKGKPTEQGTYEEFWAGPHKYKRIYTSPSFSQSVWATEDGNVRFEGQPGQPTLAFQTLRTKLVSPIPSRQSISDVTLAIHEQSRGNVKLSCLSLLNEVTGLSSPPPELFPTYCFSEDKPILRSGTNLGGSQFVANEIVLFQNRYIPKSVQINNYKHPRLTIHLDQLTGLDQTDQPALVPPTQAQRMEEIEKVEVSQADAQGYAVKKVPPVYPATAKYNQVSGMVVILATIGTDGNLS